MSKVEWQDPEKPPPLTPLQQAFQGAQPAPAEQPIEIPSTVYGSGDNVPDAPTNQVGPQKDAKDGTWVNGDTHYIRPQGGGPEPVYDEDVKGLGRDDIYNSAPQYIDFFNGHGKQPEPGTPIVQGNIDLTNRPRVKNADGSVSTVRSMGVNIDGKEVLLPTVSDDGRIMSDDEAVNQYKKTGKHLGMFSSPQDSNIYAQKLHEQQAIALGRDAPIGSDEFHAWLKQSTPEEYKAYLAGKSQPETTQPVRPETAAVAAAKSAGLAKSWAKSYLSNPVAQMVTPEGVTDVVQAPNGIPGGHKYLDAGRTDSGARAKPIDLGAIPAESGGTPAPVVGARSGIQDFWKNMADRRPVAEMVTASGDRDIVPAPPGVTPGHAFLDRGRDQRGVRMSHLDLGPASSPIEQEKQRRLLEITQGAAGRAREAAAGAVQHEQETRQGLSISPSVIDRLAAGMPVGSADRFVDNKARIRDFIVPQKAAVAQSGVSSASGAAKDALTRQFLEAMARSR